MSPRISSRIAAIAESATLAVDAKAKALKAQGRPVIGFGAGCAIFRGNHNNFRAALHALDEPVGVWHFVLDEILAVLNDQFGKPQVVEVAV